MSLFFAELLQGVGQPAVPAFTSRAGPPPICCCSGWVPARPRGAVRRSLPRRRRAARRPDNGRKGRIPAREIYRVESLVKIGGFYRDMAYAGSSYLQAYRDENAAMFDAYEQEYKDKSYTLFTDDLNTEYRLFNQLQNEYDTVAAYTDFLDGGCEPRRRNWAGILDLQNDKTGYDLKNIEQTAEVYAGLGATEIDYYPQKGLYTAISYAFTDLILLAAMLLVAAAAGSAGAATAVCWALCAACRAGVCKRRWPN